jgi:peptidoglycan-associated lipoprotein
MRVFNWITIILILITLASCSTSKLGRVALSSQEIGEYHKAIEKYRKANRKEKDRDKRMEYTYAIAECYRAIGQYEMAALYYRNTIRRSHPDPKALLWYAEMLRSSQKYEEALENYRLYLEEAPDDQQALNGIESIRLTQNWTANPTKHIINPVKELNSRESDYSPVFVGGRDNEIIFTSTRKASTGKRRSMITGQSFADLFRSQFNVQRQKWGEPQPLDQNFIVNTTAEEGAATLSGIGDQMIFTRCNYDKTRNSPPQVYATSQVRGSWAEPSLIDILGDSVMAAHPALSPDGSILYFVSDAPGGQGGKDIWMAEKSGGAYKSPVNLGTEINTPGDEMFPYVRDNGELYFSSNYHPGMGGFDIFKAVKDEDGKWSIENMGYPVNSAGDDFGIAFIQGRNEGMFSSNRKGSRSDDIYSFFVPPTIFQLAGEVYNKETNTPLDGVTVRIIGTDGTNLRMQTQNAKFQMRLQPETEYIVAGFREGYLIDKSGFTTEGLTDSKDFRVELFLTPIDNPIKLDNINYAFGSADLQPESIVALDTLIELLQANPTITIELMAHTDHVGSEQFNFELSQRRAQSVVNYLIEKGINAQRLVAKGYGETWPKTVTREIAAQYDFLKRGDELTEAFIMKLPTEEQRQIAQGINRRTEFRVLRTDYIEKFSADPQR